MAAQALVPQGMRVPPGSLVAGVPAKVKRPLTEEERQGLTLNGTFYVDLAKTHKEAHGAEARLQGRGCVHCAAPPRGRARPRTTRGHTTTEPYSAAATGSRSPVSISAAAFFALRFTISIEASPMSTATTSPTHENRFNQDSATTPT